MHAKAVLVTLLVTSASLVSAAPASSAGSKRCLGGCTNTNGSGSESNTQTTTDASTHTDNQVTTNDSGNAQTQGNNGGGNNFSGMSFGGGGGSFGGCKRAYLAARADQHKAHVAKVQGKKAPAPPKKPANNVQINKTSTNNNSINKTNTQNSGNTNIKTTNTTFDKSKSNNVKQSGNMGVINGSGNVCRREFIELEMERRELDAGAAVVAALGGGLVARNVNDHLIATRDVGKMALMLGVRAYDHDEDGDFFKRDVGLQCASADCDEMMKREAEEMLYYHARGLGFFPEDE